MTIAAQVYIARHERTEAAEAYKDRLSKAQIEAMLETEGDYFMFVHQNGEVTLNIIEDEG